MSKYTVQVVMSYIQVIEVDADSQYEAEVTAFDQFDLSKANEGEGEAWTVSVTEGESK